MVCLLPVVYLEDIDLDASVSAGRGGDRLGMETEGGVEKKIQSGMTVHVLQIQQLQKYIQHFKQSEEKPENK